MIRTLLLLLSLATPVIAETWPLDHVEKTLLIRGTAKSASGAAGESLVLDGESLIELKDSAKLGSGAFTVSLWFNPYEPTGAQQVLAGKNRYSRNERQWSLTIEPNGRLRAHLQQDGWSTISSGEALKAGAWYLATLAVEHDKAALFLNGKPAGEVKLKRPVAATDAPITLGGIWDAGSVHQAFYGALDECSVVGRALTAVEIAASYQPVSSMHDVAKQVAPAGLPLWDATHMLPKAAELPQVAGARFHIIKKQRPDEDGCRWTLGVGLAWHKGKLYASYGYNTGDENTPTEEAHVRVSGDGGVSWGRPVVMDSGEGNLGVSHGVFLSHGGRLWAFMGAFYDRFQRTHTRAYTLDEADGSWEPRGVVIDQGFWPMQEPQKMADGNWIMAGARISNGFGLQGDLPAVAISKGDDFTRWEMVVIAPAQGVGKIWGESTVIVEGRRVLNISRYGKKALALSATSEDCGRTWTHSAPSNLPMATSKPYSGILSTGQRFLVCTTTADTGGSRSPLTIAVSKPGESLFSKVFLIRRSVCDETPGVSSPKADFSYPYAVERDGNLYIGYTHKSHAANELAVIPVASLSAAGDDNASVKVTQQLLNSIHVTPKLIFDPMPAYAQKYLRFAMAASMESTSKGRLWTCWAGGQDGPNAYLLASYSDDQGRSWRDPVFVIDPQAQGLKMGTRLGSFWCDPKGRLWLFFHQSVGMFDGSCSNWFVRCDNPDAEKPVWTEPVYIGFGASLNKPIVRRNGEWILPVSLWERWHIDKPFADSYHELDAVRGSNVFVSDDEGGHWRYRGGNIFKDSCFNEHSVVEKQDGTLWMLSRCMKEIAQSFSTDGGKTWQQQTTFFPQVNSKAVFRRLQSGHLLLIKHGAAFNTPAQDSSEAWNWGKGRSYLTAFLSADDGKTWSSGLLLDERSPVSYPDIAQTPNGDIYVHYDRDRTGAAEILFARFREEDVHAGKLVSRDAALKNLVKSKQGMFQGSCGG